MMVPLFDPNDITRFLKELKRQLLRAMCVPPSVRREGKTLQVMFGNEALGRQPDPEICVVLKNMLEKGGENLSVPDILEGTGLSSIFAHSAMLPYMKEREWIQEHKENMHIGNFDIVSRTYSVRSGLSVIPKNPDTPGHGAKNSDIFSPGENRLLEALSIG